MKNTTLEGRAKTKNGVTRLVFSVICILYFVGGNIHFIVVYGT